MKLDLVDRARHSLLDGTLPSDHLKIFGGRGSGATCSLCGEAITPEMAEIELIGELGLRVVLHPNCHIALEQARQRLAAHHED